MSGIRTESPFDRINGKYAHPSKKMEEEMGKRFKERSEERKKEIEAEEKFNESMTNYLSQFPE